MSNDPRVLDRQPPAVTKPGERWDLNGYNLSSVIIDREGVNPTTGDHYRRMNGELWHTVMVARFETVRDAACAVQAHNAWSEICALYRDSESSFQFTTGVMEIIEKYGRDKS